MGEQQLSLAAVPRLEQQQNPALLQFMSLLPVPAADLESIIEREVARNPVLERIPGNVCGTCGGFAPSGRCSQCSSATLADRPAATDWRTELLALARLGLEARLHPVLELLVTSLDDRGFLTQQPHAPAEAWDRALAALREVGPPGIAATSAVDCVRVQVAGLVATGRAPVLLGRIVQDCLDEIAAGQYDVVADRLGATEQEVVESVELLRHATRPFVALPDSGPLPRAVDVVFSLPADGAPLDVRVADALGLGLRMVDDFVTTDREARDWLRPLRRDASRLLAAIDARATMVIRAARALAIAQREFIVHGDDGHRPLTREALAAELGVHPSTVGRCVNGKAARCPDGRIVDLVDFFGSGPAQRRAVAAVIGDFPGASDAMLAEELARRGSPLARRTVAKYRALLAASALAKSSSPTF